MLAYLSDEWVAAMDEALADHMARHGLDGSPDQTRLVIRQTVTGGPGEGGTYTMWFDGPRAGVGRATPDGAEPDVTFTCDRDTAVAIATGKERAQSAFLAGRLRLGGDSRRLVAHAPLLGELDDVFAAVRSRTEF